MDDNKPTLLLGLIKDILGRPLKYNKSKGQYSFDCPTCSAEKGVESDGKGNLEVNVNKGIYHCWSCGETHGTKGSIQKLVKIFGTQLQYKKLKILGFVKSKEKKDTFNQREEIELPKGFKPFKTSNPKELSYKQAWNYLTKSRGLTEDIIFKYNMGFVTGGYYEGRVIIPSYDKDGELNYFVSRTYTNQKPKYLNPDSQKYTPKEEIIFNEKFVNWDGTVYLVEGPFDHIVVPNSIPLLGKMLSPKLQAEILEENLSQIKYR
jgi:DNA primase